MLIRPQGCVLQSKASLGQITTWKKICCSLARRKPATLVAHSVAPNNTVVHATYPTSKRRCILRACQVGHHRKVKSSLTTLFPQMPCLAHRGGQQSNISILDCGPRPCFSRLSQGLLSHRCQSSRSHTKPCARRMHAALNRAPSLKIFLAFEQPFRAKS